MILVAQLFTSATSVTTAGNKHIDADTQARQVLDRIGLDLSKIVKRSDVDYYFQKNPVNGSFNGNDQMAFYSESTGYYPTGVTGSTPKSNVSLVGYRINDKFQLERLGKALIWNGVTNSTTGASGLASDASPMVFLPQTLKGTWPNIAGTGADPDYQVIGEQIYRLELNFLLKPYTDATGTVQPSIISDTPWDVRQGHSTVEGLRDVSAVIVTIAVLDNTSRLLVDVPTLTTAANKLPDGNGAIPPAKLWQTQIQNADLGLPRPAAAQVRIYQRYFYLNPLS